MPKKEFIKYVVKNLNFIKEVMADYAGDDVRESVTSLADRILAAVDIYSGNKKD